MYKSQQIFKKLSFLICTISTFMFSQTNISTEVISIRDGLSSNNIRDIIQDKFGYMWIASNDGLNIYDGYKITVLKNIPDDSTSLPNNAIWRLLEDHQGIIWVSTDDGLAKYNRLSKSFKTYRPQVLDGAFGNTIIQIYEDSRNNLWCSTLMGIHRFDRVTEKFESYEIMQTDNSIATFANSGGSILETSGNELYALGESFGLLKFDYDASLFVQVPLKDNFTQKIESNQYLTMIEDSSKNLWLGVSSGLLKVNLTEKRGYDITPFERVNAPKSNVANAASGLFLDRNNNIWVGTLRNGLFLYDSKVNSFDKILASTSTYFYTAFYKDKSGVLWFGSTRGVMRYDFDRKPFTTYDIPDEEEENLKKAVLSFSPSLKYKNQIWLGTNKGIYQFDKQNNRIKKSSAAVNKLAQLENNEISGILERNDGSLWISTAREGLFVYNFNTGNLKSYKNRLYDETTINDDRIHTLEIDKKGNIWIGTHLGINLLRKNAGTFISVPSFVTRKYDKKLSEILANLRVNSIPVSSIIKVGDYADVSKEFVLRKDSKLLIYAVGEGLSGFNMVDYGWLESGDGDTLWNESEFNETFYSSGTSKNRIKMNVMDLKAGRYKLRYKSDDSHSYESYNSTPPQDSIYWGTQIFALNDEEYALMRELIRTSVERTYTEGEDNRVIFCDSKNTIWVGTDNGISTIDSNMVIHNYIKTNSSENSLSSDLVRDINEDLNGNIWIATTDGLNKFNPQTGNFTIIREKDGLPSSNLSAIEVDDQGDLWVSGLKGISKIELDNLGNTQIIVNYDVKDGLQGYEFIGNASFKDSKGKLYFSGTDGFNAFYPGSSNRTPPFLSIQDIKISNKSVLNMDDYKSGDINFLSEISLGHDQNDISFEFASIHYSRPDKNRLLYKLDGVDEEWQIGDRRFASYTSLGPGDYVFHLRGSNGDGIWSDETKQILIHISSPWYNNWIAYTIYIVLFFGLLWIIRKFEMARQNKNARLKEIQLRAEAAELKAKAAEAQAQVVQAENDRKTKELEEARDLQLSMLPKELPQLPNLDIAVYMQTATEVGGDYYDFHVGLDGTLTVVVGDATGHGMKAGTMVTTAKSLFNSYAPNPDILFTFSEITRCIKQMNFGKLSMCMTMVKIKGNKLQISTAGMPSSFIFRRDTRVVEEHMFKAMPLGTMDKFPYELKDTTLSPGDTILLMSDGLPELENDKGEMYGYKRIRNGFEDIAEKSPEEIIGYLKGEGSSWVNDEAPDDDVTFVVIKVK